VAAEPVARPARRLQGLTRARTSFVGRSGAVDKVAVLLDSYRLVTVTGPGGVGKTRLADEVLKQVAGRFADGVRIVELAAVSEPALVNATVATTLDVRQAAGVPIVEALAEHLSRQQLLLVLDNCEHVLDEAADLCAVLLASADDVKILATSREPLGLSEEARYRLSPLGLPEQDAQGTTVQSEAVTLFVERARQLDPDFSADGEAGFMLDRLVRRLDGMPLAIELAAARVEALSLAELLDRLDDWFALLVNSNRAASARQRSLETTVAWSYQLLSEAEGRVFRWLAVFPGPFTLEAAMAVAGTGARTAVLRLVDCSLLVPPVPGADGRSRYLMLEMLRSYGRTRLQEIGEEREAAVALAEYALIVAEQAAAQMAVRIGELPAAAWLDAEDATVHQALTWALDHDPPTALRLADALASWWWMRGRWIQGSGLLRRAIDQAEPNTDHWYSAHLWLGSLARGTFEREVALSHYGTVVEALRDGPPCADLVEGLLGRCAVLRNMTDLGPALADARSALEFSRQISYVNGEATALRELSLIFSYAGDDEQSVEWARQANRIDRDHMPGWLAREIESTLPWTLVVSGQLDGALDICVQALTQARKAGDLSGQTTVLFLMAVLARKTGRFGDARAHLREAVELAAFASYRLRLIDLVEEGGCWSAAEGQYSTAVTLWAARDAQFVALGFKDTPSEAREREHPLQEARQVLDAQQLRTAQERGAAMTLAAAGELVIMTTDERGSVPLPLGPGKLSSRERELITLVARGQTDAQIAEQLFISVSTVRTHLDRIRDKSGCRRRADLTRLALQERVI
jgi:predicted ATPase/DNA-binding CsgD family transcriptional regulator